MMVHCMHVNNCIYIVAIKIVAQHSDSLVVPSMTAITANDAVEYQVEGMIRIIVGHEVIRFRVPMVERYENARTGLQGVEQSTITISPTVPGAQYRITAWTIGHTDNNFRRSAMPATGYAKTEQESELHILYKRHCYGYTFQRQAPYPKVNMPQ